ncbi:efflux RND transporter periplasmic adaptor subunit [Tautonia sociabilis]|uniref:Efflux RND transporter periplasmic adaptor subunit n=1 Tax=Tautonia sociabilis TaxID=2080755 RepID=A0A432ME83_9BACT|nr:efflux RND transporter periplasmic adaptor subunit [Tautonia sociabilis]RUL83558.1 efflux RND transporter periplasmic adaptor subunit [Tautonia sociabilis]
MRRTTGTQPRGGTAVQVLLALALVLAGGAFIVYRLTATPPEAENPTPGKADQLWTCGMHPQVIRDKPGNCPICHMKLTPLEVDSEAAPTGEGSTRVGRGAPAKERKVKYWWDPMLNPPYISDKPGKSPMGMDLVPVYEDEAPAGLGLTIDPALVQNMGVRTETVIEGRLERAVRAAGYLAEAEPNIHDVNLLVSGWIRRLYADTEGMQVREGDPLFDLYSPELEVATQELIAGRRALPPPGADETSRQTGEALYAAAVRKLELWGVGRGQIEALSRGDRPSETVTFRSPITGHVVKKATVEGAAIKAGDQVLRIVDHSVLWVDAQVFEQNLKFVSLGQRAEATVAGRPGETFAGEVIFIHPHLDMTTRTATVRFAVPNRHLVLKPGMYATVTLRAKLAEKTLLVPREAVIDTGTRQVAFVSLEDGHFEAREVKKGLSDGRGTVQVLEGLLPGERVVTSGQFLLDSESRLREAVQKYLRERNGRATVPSPNGPRTTVSQPSGAGEKHSAAPPVDPELQPHIDAVFSEYLRLSATLGAPQKDVAIDPGPLISAAGRLSEALPSSVYREKASSVRESARALQGRELAEQRELFRSLSAGIISLAEALPPSATVGEKLLIVHCPMSGADWVQASPEVANPYYADSMKQCGEVTGTIEPAAGRRL